MVSKRTWPLIRTLVPAAVAGLVTALLVNVITTLAPEWEGNIWPVAITHSLEYKAPTLQKFFVTGVATKVRDCQLLATEIFVTGDGVNRTLARLNTNSNVALRPIGSTFTWGPWEIDVPVFKTTMNIKAVTTHRCHPLWPTRSVFWEIDVP